MIDKNTLTKPINKKVLLCSSGMDSYIINTLEKPDEHSNTFLFIGFVNVFLSIILLYIL